MTIRKMKLTDINQVFDILKQTNTLHRNNRPDIYNDIAPHKDYRVEKLQNQINEDKSILLIAEDDNKIVGYCIAEMNHPSANPVHKPRTVVYIDSIAVDKNHQGSGIGKQLYAAIVDKAKQIKADSIELSVFNFNKKAIGFYESLGMNVKTIKYEIKL